MSQREGDHKIAINENEITNKRQAGKKIFENCLCKIIFKTHSYGLMKILVSNNISINSCNAVYL